MINKCKDKDELFHKSSYMLTRIITQLQNRLNGLDNASYDDLIDNLILCPLLLQLIHADLRREL